MGMSRRTAIWTMVPIGAMGVRGEDGYQKIKLAFTLSSLRGCKTRAREREFFCASSLLAVPLQGLEECVVFLPQMSP